MIPTTGQWIHGPDKHVARFHTRVSLREIKGLHTRIQAISGIENVRLSTYHILITKGFLFEWEEIEQPINKLLEQEFADLKLQLEVAA